MWQECIAPRSEGEKMQTLLKTKIGPFLVISSVLALWTLLAAQSMFRRTPLRNLSLHRAAAACLRLKTFLTHQHNTEAAVASPGALNPTLLDKAGRGDCRQMGAIPDITTPKLPSPDLPPGSCECLIRATDAANISDAVLCQRTSERARYRTTYTSHDRTSCRHHHYRIPNHHRRIRNHRRQRSPE